MNPLFADKSGVPTGRKNSTTAISGLTSTWINRGLGSAYRLPDGGPGAGQVEMSWGRSRDETAGPGGLEGPDSAPFGAPKPECSLHFIVYTLFNEPERLNLNRGVLAALSLYFILE